MLMTLPVLPFALLLTLTATAGRVAAGVGTVFDVSSRDAANPHHGLACLRDRPLDRDKDVLVAHRTLPCRSAVLVCVPRTGKCARAVVGDRGPRRALVDMTPLLARAVGHSGLEAVVVVPLVMTGIALKD